MRVTKVLLYSSLETTSSAILDCLFKFNLESLRRYQENIRRIIRREPIEIYFGFESSKDIERWI